MPGEEHGVCAACPSALEDCLAESVGTSKSKKSCLECGLHCHYLYWGDVTMIEDGEVLLAYALGSYPFYSTPGSATAPLVECSDLVLDRVDTCPGAMGSICLIHDYVKDSYFYKLAGKCEASGGIAMILYFSDLDFNPDDLPGEAYLKAPVNIPAVRVLYDNRVS